MPGAHWGPLFMGPCWLSFQCPECSLYSIAPRHNSVDRPPSDLLPTASVLLLWEPKVCFHLYLQKNSKMTIIIIIQLPFKIFWLHNQESRLWCRQGSHLSVERVPAASWLGTRFQVSHGYFMKYYMMGLLQMPNIMSSIEADRLICWKLDILSH